MRRPRNMAAAVAVALAMLGGCGGDASGGQGIRHGRTFCDAVRAYAALAQDGTVSVNVDSSMSADEVERRIAEAERGLEAQVRRGREVLDDLEARAPAEVKPDLAVAVEAERRMLAALEASGYDPFALLGDPSLRPDPVVAAAWERVNDYTVEACAAPLKPPLPEVPGVPEIPVPDRPWEPPMPRLPGAPTLRR